MIITLQMLQEKDACGPSVEWFVSHFPDGADYQAALNKAAETDKADYADWLLSNFGGTDDALELDEITGQHFFFAGSITVRTGITLTGSLKIARSIKAGDGIKAG